MYLLIHDKQAYEECKIVIDKQKDQIKLGDSLLAIGEGEKVNLKEQVANQTNTITEKETQYEAFKEKKKGQVRNLIKLVIGETGIIIVETIIIVLLII